MNKINKTNYVRWNNGNLEIYTDNAVFYNGETQTSFGGKSFEISGEDLMKIYALLQDREITTLSTKRDKYVVVGNDVEKRRLMGMYVNLLNEIEKINETRHWWERKIKIDSEL
jgi:hypothetical protein